MVSKRVLNPGRRGIHRGGPEVTEVEIVAREDDGAAWFKDNKIFINIRWVQIEEETVWFLDESFMHEYVEHVLGLGHNRAVFVEKLLRETIYSEWYGQNPLSILYGNETNRSRMPSRESLPTAHAGFQQFLSRRQGALAPS